jgi:hypothetical protein
MGVPSWNLHPLHHCTDSIKTEIIIRFFGVIFFQSIPKDVNIVAPFLILCYDTIVDRVKITALRREDVSEFARGS